MGKAAEGRRSTTLSIDENHFRQLTLYSGIMSVERRRRTTISDVVNEALDAYFTDAGAGTVREFFYDGVLFLDQKKNQKENENT